jgi:hypothetical protein
LKGWRDLSLWTFEEDKVSNIQVDNEHGTFLFTKTAGKSEPAKDADAGAPKAEGGWDGKFKAGKTAAARPIDRFDDNKVKDLLRTYKTLSADNFAQDKKDADVGLDKPVATITLTLQDGGKRVLHFGSTAEGSSRWAKKDGDEQIYSVGSWTAEWATSDQTKFQKAEEKKEDGDKKPVDKKSEGAPPMVEKKPG